MVLRHLSKVRQRILRLVDQQRPPSGLHLPGGLKTSAGG
jgi:hypothetical protein